MPVDRNAILESMARTLWVTEYTQELEENEMAEEPREYDEDKYSMAGPGEDWFEYRPSMARGSTAQFGVTARSVSKPASTGARGSGAA